MKWPAVIMICSGIAIGTVQLTNCKPQQIKQRYVKVYVMAPEGNSVIWEPAKD